MKLPTFRMIQKRPGLFWLFFIAPLLATAVGLRAAPDVWIYFMILLVVVFFIVLKLVQALHDGAIVDHWGILNKDDHPTRYWLQVGVWIAMVVCAAAFPLAVVWLRLRH